MRLLNGFIIIAALAGCSKAEEKPEQEPIEEPYTTEHAAGVERVESKFLDRGFVVSVNQDGTLHAQGDSLLFTSLFVASVRCDQALFSEQALQRMILVGGGQVRRHPDINAATIDGVIGLFRAASRRYKLGCAGAWPEVIAAFKAYTDANHGAFNERSASGLDAFDYALRALVDRFSGGTDGDFDNGARDAFADAMANWAVAVQVGYEAWKAGAGLEDPPSAYRVHLALQGLETLEDLGIGVPGFARDKFCAATKYMEMPTVNHWCGRNHIREWLPTFRYNEWEFRHQRAGRWETPDGQGRERPGVDYLAGIAQGFVL